MSYPGTSPPRFLLPWPILGQTWWHSGYRSTLRPFASRTWALWEPSSRPGSCQKSPLPICWPRFRTNRDCRPVFKIHQHRPPNRNPREDMLTLKQSMITWVSSYESARNRSNSSWPAVSQSDSSMCTLSTKRSWTDDKHVNGSKRWDVDVIYHGHNFLMRAEAVSIYTFIFKLGKWNGPHVPKTVGSLYRRVKKTNG